MILEKCFSTSVSIVRSRIISGPRRESRGGEEQSCSTVSRAENNGSKFEKLRKKESDESLRFSSRIFSFFPPPTFELSREIHFAMMIIYNNNSDKFERKKERKD